MASTLTNILVHFVFSTKDRTPTIPEELREELYSYIGGILRNERGRLIAIGGMPDHVHLLVRLHPDLAVSEAIRKIKANSSRWLNQKARRRFAWQTGYGAFSVSESQVKVVERYIASQEEHHRKRSFQEEYLELLKKHGLDFDERYVLG